MIKVSVIILTKNRAELLRNALASVLRQLFSEYEIIVVNDGSTDGTKEVLKSGGAGPRPVWDLKIIHHQNSVGITKSRQEGLEQSRGELVAFLDDDDEWVDAEKLKKQVEWFSLHPQGVLCGGGIRVEIGIMNYKLRMRVESDSAIRRTILFRNNFFTSTVMFRRQEALEAGGFIVDGIDLAEDYDLWLRLGKKGQMGNIPEVFTAYRNPSYTKEKFRQFLRKQLHLIKRHKRDYPHYFFSVLILRLRLFFGF